MEYFLDYLYIRAWSEGLRLRFYVVEHHRDNTIPVITYNIDKINRYFLTSISFPSFSLTCFFSHTQKKMQVVILLRIQKA